ncbi:CocE/NonD family hydrolase [Rhodococcus fascians]|nr:CocE/NonD family hydrolase [Rhodococcus fascians]MBY4237866.1 CocE/NonD family hydrolase [Rhodococcus fascians]MBY4253383.1 CocE/NonD family hydrolase [Rhodococcus fascians]MBY4269020.1 CocE/NonD family hydrolase [Rhodococcus fascians]MBY4275073.1 CocE/NonD family hydrolase [Rhodococcus fascians]
MDDLLIGWFDHWLKGIDNGVDRLDPVVLWENGSERWIGKDTWPDQNTEYQRLYLTADRSGTSQSLNDGSLRTVPPSMNGSDTEVIDPTNGVCSRQTVQYLGGLPVYLPISFFLSTFPIKEVPNIDQIAPCFRVDDRINEVDVLTYTTEAAGQDLTLTGPVALTLRGSSTAADPSWVARLSDVAPDGTARPVGEGSLVASRRALDPARTGYAANGDVVEPFHWHTPETAQPVVAGAVETYNVEIWPTCWMVRAGHRLRVTIDGAELPHLLPTTATPKRLGNLTVHRDPASPSFLSIPTSRGKFG